MISVDALDMSYHGNALFKAATFTLQPGERCGLVGRNGSGKTTLLRLLSKEEIPDSGSITVRKNYTLGILNQHIKFTKPTIIEEAALGLKPTEKDCLYKAETILFGLGFNKEDLIKPISAFSGGYHLRLHLAKVLIGEPDCLFLDEPTNYLDIVSMRWLTRFLQNWKGEFILISHDREFMDNVTTHTMGIHRQKIKKVRGSTVDFYEKIMLEEEIHEKTRVNADKKRAHAQSFIDRFGAKASKAAQAQSRQKLLDRIPVLERLKEINHLDFKFNEAFFPGKKMLEAKDVSFSYTEEPLIKNLTLAIEKGQKIAIIGKNGRGKSTILRLLAKDLPIKDGVLNHSDNIAIGYFGQTNIDRLNPKHTIEEEISSSNIKLNRTETKAICGLMMFSGDVANKKTSVLSGGEKSRVLLGKIIAKPCNLLLLDEPTHHLDMESIEALIDALEEYEGSFVLVTHSELILKRLNFDLILICHEKHQEIFLGNYEEFLATDGWHDQVEEKVKAKPKNEPPKSREKSDNKSKQSNKKIELEIDAKQNQLTKLEEAQQQLNEALIQMLHDQKNPKIPEHTKTLKTMQIEIDRLYAELDDLYRML